MTNEKPEAGENALVSKPMGAVSEAWRAHVDAFAEMLDRAGPSPYPIEHHIHAGVYSRTGCQPAGQVCATVLVRVPTQLIVSGHCRIYCEDQVFEVKGYKVLEGLPGRQMIVYTYEDTWATVLFATEAKTVEEAEAEAVGDQITRLMNHRSFKCSEQQLPQSLRLQR